MPGTAPTRPAKVPARWAVVCVACAVLCGCGLLPAFLRRPTPAPGLVVATRPEQVVGVWHTRRHVFEFVQDGTYRVAEAGGDMEKFPGVKGRYHFEADELVVEDSGGGQSCLAGQVGRYRVEVLARGYLTFESLHEGCPGRQEILTRSIWLWNPPE